MIKYVLPYKATDNSDWLVELDFINYTSDLIQVRGVEYASCILEYIGGGVDNQWDYPVIDVSATMSVYHQGQIDEFELFSLNDRDCTVTIKRNNELKFKGYLIVDGQQIQLGSGTTTMQLRAKSGIALLEAMEFNIFDASLGSRCPLNYFRRILMHQLGIDLPIRWSSSLEAVNSSISGEPFQNLKWSQYGDGIMTNTATERIKYQSCKYIIEGLTKALQCRLFQADGAWWILGINEQLKDDFEYYECTNATGLPVVTQHTRSNNRNIGNEYRLVNDDATIENNAGRSSVTVKYEHNQLENILPNGGLDQWVTGALMWWGVDNSFDLMALQHDSITDRGGSAIELWNVSGNIRKFGLRDPLPIDGHTLYNVFKWGFTVMPISGFPIDPVSGFIDWKNSSIKASVKYTVSEAGTIIDYYLNEHGYWQSKNGPANQQVTGTNWHPAADTFNITFDQTKSFFIGDKVFIRYVRGGSVINKTFTFIETMDVQSGVEAMVSALQDGFMSNPNAWTLSINNTNNDSRNKAYTEKDEDYFKYIRFTVDGLKFHDSASVQYTGAGSLENKIINPGEINKETLPGIGLLSVDFIIEPGQRIVLDEIWMNVNQNHDVYKAIYTSLGNSYDKEITLPISSAFSGFNVSNFMRQYSTSNEDWLFTDGTNIGSLTELYARAVMRCVYSSNMVFNGSISVRGKDWSFLDNYTIKTLDGKKFLPERALFNTSKNEVTLTAVEYRNDDIPMSIEHYGSEEEKKLNYQGKRAWNVL